MLLELTRIEDENIFENLIENLKKFYFPYQSKYRSINEYKNLLDKIVEESKSSTDEDTKRKNIREIIIKKFITKHDGYPVCDYAGKIKTRVDFPHIEYFHEYFFRRKWIERSGDIHNESYYSLEPTNDSNYSINYINYYHFVNVVVCLARLIHYFSNGDKIRKHFNIDGNNELQFLYDKVSYQREYKRIFLLMLSGVYHDIGKTIINERHGIEGATILSDNTFNFICLINNLIKKLPKRKQFSFNRDDLLFISNLVLYHDQFGTLGTGEDGYLRLVKILEFIKIYSYQHYNEVKKKDELFIKNQQCLLDLWILNISDILVSITNKSDDQITDWKSEEISTKKLNDFFESQEGQNRIHDFKVAFNLLKSFCSIDNKIKIHTNDASLVRINAFESSKYHHIERIRRLITASLNQPVNNAIIKYKEKKVSVICQEIKEKLNSKDWISTIDVSIKSISDSQEFCNRFSWIGKMDYALGFFSKIAYRSLERINIELEHGEETTFWIRPKMKEQYKIKINLKSELLDKINAQFFLDNYSAIVVRTLHYLLFREPSIDHPRNIQFVYATKGLTEQKIDKISALAGPYQANRSIQLILENIYTYKA
jgi:hypothetical protein